MGAEQASTTMTTSMAVEGSALVASVERLESKQRDLRIATLVLSFSAIVTALTSAVALAMLGLAVFMSSAMTIGMFVSSALIAAASGFWSHGAQARRRRIQRSLEE